MRLVTLILSLAAAGFAGWTVFGELGEVFGGRFPLIGGIAAGAVVLPLLYFPLLRPLGDLLQDRLGALHNRLRHDRAGTGLGDVPDRPVREPTAPRIARCGLCGGPGGPVCAACHDKLSKS
jgi:hypothetical protein